MQLYGRVGIRIAKLGSLGILVAAFSVCCLAAPPEGTPKDGNVRAEESSANTSATPQDETSHAETVHSRTTAGATVAPTATTSHAASVHTDASPTVAATQRDQYITIEGAKIHYVEEGSGQAVVLLHGNDGTLQDFTMSLFD